MRQALVRRNSPVSRIKPMIRLNKHHYRTIGIEGESKQSHEFILHCEKFAAFGRKNADAQLISKGFLTRLSR
jgi:hypothetical protein